MKKKEKYKIEKKELENDYKLLGRKRNRENIFEISNLIEVNYLNNGKEKAKKNNDEIKEFDMNIHRKRNRKNSISNSNSSKRSNHSIVHNNDIVSFLHRVVSSLFRKFSFSHSVNSHKTNWSEHRNRCSRRAVGQASARQAVMHGFQCLNY